MYSLGGDGMVGGIGRRLEVWREMALVLWGRDGVVRVWDLGWW